MRTLLFVVVALGLSVMGVVWSRVHSSAPPRPAVSSSRENQASLDGLYFLPGSRTLRIAAGRFVLSDFSGARTSLSGSVAIHAENKVVFSTLSLPKHCQFSVIEGHLWVGLLGRHGAGSGKSPHFGSDDCDTFFGEYDSRAPHPVVTWDEGSGEWAFTTPRETIKVARTFVDGDRLSPQLEDDRLQYAGVSAFRRVGHDALITAWSLDLGPVGVRPAISLNAAGSWRGVDSQVEVRVESSPARPPEASLEWNMSEPDFSLLHWQPDSEGVSAEHQPLGHPIMNHLDRPLVVTWVMLDANTALRRISGGCDGAERPVERFQRL